MASSTANKGSDPSAESRPTITGLSLSTIIPPILEDCLYNVIHDLVITTHRTEKILRMQSVAVNAETEASRASGGIPTTPVVAQTTPSKLLGGGVGGGPLGALNSNAPQATIETTCAKYENGRVFMKGNPLKVMKDIYCPQCKLPRLLFPITGLYSKLPENISRQYCTLHPFIQKSGHDIYGNPFPVDQTGMTKKELEALKKQERREKDNTPGSQEVNEDGTFTEEAGIKKLMAGGKPASYVPWQTCPQCKRSLLITKFAQHLEKCLGIGGRAARNAAVARLAGTGGGSQHGSQSGSRAGTPTPSQLTGNGKRDAAGEDDDDELGPPKKKSKLLGGVEKKKEKGGKGERFKEEPSSTKKEGRDRDRDRSRDRRDRDRTRDREESPDREPSSSKKDRVLLKIGSGKLKSSSSGLKDRERDRDSKDSKVKGGRDKDGTPRPGSRADDGGGSAKRGRDTPDDETPRKKVKVKERERDRSRDREREREKKRRVDDSD